MQNKGIVIVTAVLLTLASIFYLSFSAATKYYDTQAAKLSDPIAQQDYKDSVKYMGIYSYQKCLETQIGLGLDLKGGMNVILEISVPDVVEMLADHKTDPAFVKSMKEAKVEEETSQSDFISLFIKAYQKNAPGHRLAEIFATQQLQGKVSPQSTDKEVEKALRDEVQAAIDNSFNVVRTRIDQFGVVQPNIQKLEGQQGRIMVEMPGIREPERMRKLLQGSANLEFWETYNSNEIIPYLTQIEARLANDDENVDTTKVDKFFGPKENAEVYYDWSDLRRPFLLWLLGVLLLIAAAYMAVQIKNNHRILPKLKLHLEGPPHKCAMRQIAKLQTNRPEAPEEAHRYYADLTDIVRTYIARRYGFKATAMTSAQIIERLRDANESKLLAELQEMFEAADLVKYAGLNTAIDENDRNLVIAIEYVNATKETEADKKRAPKLKEEPKVKRSRRQRYLLIATNVAVALAGLTLFVWSVVTMYNMYY